MSTIRGNAKTISTYNIHYSKDLWAEYIPFNIMNWKFIIIIQGINKIRKHTKENYNAVESLNGIKTITT